MMRRNPRRTRRRIDPADLWEPLDGPLHVKHSHAGQKPAPAPLLDAEWLAAHDDTADLFDGPHGRGPRPMTGLFDRMPPEARERARQKAAELADLPEADGEPSQDPKSPESRDIANRSAGDCEG